MINPMFINDIDEMETEVSEENKERFKINDLSSLSWAMRKLSAIEAKKTEVNNLINEEKERIEQYRTKEMKSFQNSEDFFNALITDYAERKRLEDPKFKQKTPYGSIGFRKQPDKWNYDEEVLIQHLEENGLNKYVRIKKEPVKTEIKKAFVIGVGGYVFDSNGDEINGIIVEQLPDKLDIKVGE